MKRLILLLISLPLVTSCSDQWGWYVVDPTTKSGLSNLKFLLSGLEQTILMSFTAIAISMVVGLAVALPGMAAAKGWRRFNSLRQNDKAHRINVV